MSPALSQQFFIRPKRTWYKPTWLYPYFRYPGCWYPGMQFNNVDGAQVCTEEGLDRLWTCLTWRRPRWNSLKGLCTSSGLPTPPGPSGVNGKCCWGHRCLECPVVPADVVTHSVTYRKRPRSGLAIDLYCTIHKILLHSALLMHI